MTTLTPSALDAQRVQLSVPKHDNVEQEGTIEKMIAVNRNAQGSSAGCPFSMGRGPARMCPNQPQSMVIGIVNEVNSVVQSVHQAVEGAVTDVVGQIFG